jgi:cytochrome c553
LVQLRSHRPHRWRLLLCWPQRIPRFRSPTRRSRTTSLCTSSSTPTAFFAQQSAPYAAQSAYPTPEQLQRGRLLVRVGDESKQLQACANCHGPDGSGERYAAPYLAGQSAIYLANAIREWKAGTRHSGEKQMGPVVLRLDDQDIATLSAYLESLGEVSH